MSDKLYTFHFYQLAPSSAEDALRELFEYHIKNGTNIPHALNLNNDHHIQIQDLKSHKTSLGYLISGVMKKYSKKDNPRIGEVGESKERPIEMTQDEALIEKTYFLYSFSHHVLLYQTNSRGTSCRQFSHYLAIERLGTASFEPLLTADAYNMLRKDNLKLKKFEVSFASPTNPQILQAQGNSEDWTDNALSFLVATGGSRMKIAVTGGMRGGSGKNLTSEAKDFLFSLAGKINSNEEATSDLRGKIELIDEEHISHPLDLVANRLSVNIDIPMDGRYPKEGAILTRMMTIMKEKESEIRDIVGYDEE